MSFTKSHDIDQINSEMKGKRVVIGGWIEDIRNMGKMTFLTVRDITGLAQVIIKGEITEQLKEVNRQSVVRISGTVQDTKAKDFDYEISAEKLQVLAKAIHPLPIDPIGRLESSIDNRLNNRALDMRNIKTASIFKLRHHTLSSLRKNLIAKKFIEINTPKIIGSASEGGANLFSLDYFGKTAYLAQSPQLYKEQMTLGLERVFEISAFYRAEKSHTGRHLSEFTSVDIEAAFMDYTDVMDILEFLIINTYKEIAENCKEELENINRQISVPKAPFDRISYQNVIDELQSEGERVNFGEDLLDSHLRIIGEKHPGFYFITEWPLKLKPFYIREMEDTPHISRSFDLQYGYLELSSGGTRLHDPTVIKSRLLEQGLNPAQFSDHLKTYEWGMPPHAGWGMGFERLMATIVGTDNVREVTLYPRDPERLAP